MDVAVPSKQCMANHVAVRLEDCIVVLKSNGEPGFDNFSEFWTYNLWTEVWLKHMIPEAQPLYDTMHQCGVAIGKDIYIVFGQELSSLLLKLTRNTDGSFVWSTINIEDLAKTPLPRTHHCGWEHGKKLWVFGGSAMSSPNGYLNNHGDFHRSLSLWITNQLICYNPSMQSWRDVQCYGNVPSPRFSSSVAIIKDIVWMHGGITETHAHHDIHKLSMNSIQWTRINTNMPEQEFFNYHWPLTPITRSQLAVHPSGGNVTWIFDVLTHEWRKYQRQHSCRLYSVTGTTGLNSNVIILGVGQQDVYNLISVMLEPASLQQLAMKTIHQLREALPWNSLPSSIKNKFMITETN